MQYVPNEYISEDEFNGSQMFRKKPDRISGCDLVFGVIGKTKTKFSHLHAEYKKERQKQNSNGETETEIEWLTIFKGLFFTADFNKDFKGLVLLEPALIETNRLLNFDFLGFSQMKRIKLEDPKFEKFFTAKGNDQIEARYILSTSLMERLKNLRNKANSDMYVSFVNSRIYIGITGEIGGLNPNFLGTVVNFEKNSKYFTLLQFYTGIVEELNLNIRIWSKS